MAELKTRVDIEKWLSGQPKEVALVFAARAALRAVPFLKHVDVFSGALEANASAIILPSLYGVATALFASMYPDRAVDLIDAADSAVSSAGAVGAARSAGSDALSALSARSALSANRYSVSAALSVSDFTPSVPFSAFAASSADSAALSASRSLLSTAGSGLYTAFDSDKRFIENGGSVALLAAQRLWPNPKLYQGHEEWTALKIELKKLKQNWKVWIDWYEARLRGDTLKARADLEIGKLEFLAENWKKGAAVANNELHRIIDEYDRLHKAIDESEVTGSDSIESTTIPTQKSATIRAVWKGDVVTFDVRPVDTDLSGELAHATLKALKLEFTDFIAGITTGNMNANVVSYLGQSADMIPDDLPDTTLLQRLAVRESTLRHFVSHYGQEWNDFTLSQITVLVQKLSNALDQFPARREFKRSMLEIDLRDIPAIEREDMIARLIALFSSQAGQNVIDGALTNRIKDIGREDRFEAGPNKTIDAETTLIIHADQLESANNTLKAVAEALTDKDNAAALMKQLEPIYVDKMGDGIKDGVAEAGYEDGKRLAKAAIRAKAAKELGTVAAEKAKSRWPKMFDWVKPILERGDKG